jgi:ubiquitin C-terminal hydrolase
MSNAYYNVIKNLWNRDNNNKSFSPNEFKEKLSKENPLFEGIAANDSKDLINFLLERFHNELNIKKVNHQNYKSNAFNIDDQLIEQKMLEIFTNEFKIKYNSIISNLFYGTLETKSQCQRCNQIKYNFQIFSFLEFPLEKVNLYCFNTGKRNNYNMFNNKNPDIDLYECFEYNNNLELMTGDNQMYCNICNCTCDSLYGSTLYSTPNYLIINLNRGRGAVYECNVNFPEQLNLFNYVSFKNGNTVYELYAVICHIGPSSMSGHFIAFCKNRIDKKWYKYNDAFVTLCQSPNEYRSGMPYILFYKVLLSS